MSYGTRSEHCGWLKPIGASAKAAPLDRSVDIIAAEGPTITDALARLGEEIELAASSVPPPSWQG